MSIRTSLRWHTPSLGIALALVFAAPLVTLAAPVAFYDITELGTLGGSTSDARGINSSGQVVGAADTVSGSEHTYLWSSGKMQDLGTLGGAGSGATAINDAGQVIGSADVAGGGYHAFVGTESGLLDLGTLPGDKSSIAYGMNAAGQVVGTSLTVKDNGSIMATRAVLWMNGIAQDLGSLRSNTSNTSSLITDIAYGINAAGQVVGWSTVPSGGPHAFLWSGGKMQDLTPPNLTDPVSVAFGINDSGQVVGAVNTAPLIFSPSFLAGTRAARWTEGRFQDLGTLSGYYRSLAYGINAAGTVVGVATNEAAYGNSLRGHAFVYSDTTGMVDLNSLIDPSLGWELQSAYSINGAGQIVGEGMHNGNRRGFLLTLHAP
jgi:probable HAF family extracellular repeat protein